MNTIVVLQITQLYVIMMVVCDICLQVNDIDYCVEMHTCCYLFTDALWYSLILISNLLINHIIVECFLKHKHSTKMFPI